jgi:hypothetical protein
MSITDCIGDFTQGDITVTIKPTSWSKVFSGSCGRLMILCFLVSLVLFIAMLIYIGIYANSVLNHPNTICVPYSFIAWSIVMPIVLVLKFLTALYVIRFCLGARKNPMGYRRLCSNYIFFIFYIIFLVILIWVPIFNITGLIIKGDNDTDIMFQLLVSYGGDPPGWVPNILPVADPGSYPDAYRVYPIFFQPDGINDTFPHSTCDHVPFSDLCPVFGPLRSTNLSGVFRCRPNRRYSLEPFTPFYSKPLSGIGITGTHLASKFAFLFSIAWIHLLHRRLLPPDQWMEHQCCRSSPGEWDERILLI